MAAVIELDRPPVRATAAAPGYRRAGAVLAGLLLLLLTGAAPAAAPAWHRVGHAALPGRFAAFQLAGATLVATDVEDGVQVTTGYAAGTLRRLWRTAGPSGVDTTDPGRVEVAGDAVLLHNGPRTTVLDARTGAVRFASPVPVQALDGRTGLVQDPRFRPGTAYDTGSGDPGLLWTGPDGTVHTEPPQRTGLRGVDLRSGATTWTATVPGAVSVWPGAPGSAAVLVAATDRLVLRAAATGAVLRERALPPAGGVRFSEVVGDVVLVRQGDGVSEQVQAYALGDLAPRWDRTQQPGPGSARYCTGLACLLSATALSVVDPATGAERWRPGDRVDRVVLVGPGALEVDADAAGGGPVRTVDPGTGRARVDLRQWRSYAAGPAAASLVLARSAPGEGTDFGLLRPGWPAVRPLGRSPRPLSECQSDDRRVACLTGDGVEVWRFRP